MPAGQLAKRHINQVPGTFGRKRQGNQLPPDSLDGKTGGSDGADEPGGGIAQCIGKRGIDERQTATEAIGGVKCRRRGTGEPAERGHSLVRGGARKRETAHRSAIATLRLLCSAET